MSFWKKREGWVENQFLSSHQIAHVLTKNYACFVFPYLNQCVLRKYKGTFKSEAVLKSVLFLPALF